MKTNIKNIQKNLINEERKKWLSNQDLEFETNMNSKLYIYSKYIYYCFEKNYSKQNLNMQIIINLINTINQMNYNPKYDSLSFDLFLQDMSKYFYNNKKYKALIVFFCGAKGYYKCFVDYQMHKAIYDKYTKRKILSIFKHIYITQKNQFNDLIFKSNKIKGFNLIYFDDIKKNIIALKEFENINFPIDNTIIWDIENGKILSRIQLPKEFKNNSGFIKFLLLENKY